MKWTNKRVWNSSHRAQTIKKLLQMPRMDPVQTQWTDEITDLWPTDKISLEVTESKWHMNLEMTALEMSRLRTFHFQKYAFGSKLRWESSLWKTLFCKYCLWTVNKIQFRYFYCQCNYLNFIGTILTKFQLNYKKILSYVETIKMKN